MAGHNKPPSILFDPAIEKWYHMKENTHANFKFDRRTTTISLLLTVAFPGLMYYLSSKYNNYYSIQGIKRGDVTFLTSERK